MSNKKTLNIVIDTNLWKALAELAHKQSILQKKTVPAIGILRLAIKVFLALSAEEVNGILQRTRDSG